MSLGSGTDAAAAALAEPLAAALAEADLLALAELVEQPDKATTPAPAPRPNAAFKIERREISMTSPFVHPPHTRCGQTKPRSPRGATKPSAAPSSMGSEPLLFQAGVFRIRDTANSD